MCKWGTTETVEVTMSAGLSHTGLSFKKKAQIDKCLAPIVQALESNGVLMLSSCCGHGKTNGIISLVDGRKLIIVNKMKRKNRLVPIQYWGQKWK